MQLPITLFVGGAEMEGEVMTRSIVNHAKILLVEGEAHFQNLYRQIITEAGYDVVIVSSGEQALARLNSDRYDVVLASSRLPGMAGDQLVRTIRLLQSDVRTMFISTYPDIVMRAKHCSADAYYAKCEPFTTLLDIIDRLVSGSKTAILIGGN